MDDGFEIESLAFEFEVEETTFTKMVTRKNSLPRWNISYKI